MDNAEITSLIVAIAKAHRSALSETLRGLGLFIGQDILLVRVVDAGAASQKAVATSLALDEATVSESITKLARAGLVERLPDEADRRAYRIVATDEGITVAERVRDAWAECEATAVASLSDEQIATLRAALTSVLVNLPPGWRHPRLPR